MDRRLHLVSQIAPLLARRNEILDLKRELQDTSKERLLSKKGNMAKALLMEENARRQFSKEIPRIHSKLESLGQEWERNFGRPLTIHGIPLSETIGADQQSERPGSNKENMSSVKSTPVALSGKRHRDPAEKTPGQRSPVPFRMSQK
jgi:hypothetical protein